MLTWYLQVFAGIVGFDNSEKAKHKTADMETVSIEDLFKAYNVPRIIDYLSLDIEGAENQVIPYFLKRKIYPKQLLVEFDELSTGFILPYLKALFIFIKLNINSYKLVKTEDFPNFLFIRENN